MSHLTLSRITQAWNERLDELHKQDTEILRAKAAHLDRLNSMVCESNEEVRRELRRSGYLL